MILCGVERRGYSGRVRPFVQDMYSVAVYRTGISSSTQFGVPVCDSVVDSWLSMFQLLAA